MTKNLKGAFLMTLASVCFSTAGVLFKHVSWSAMSANGVRTFIAACMFVIYMKITHKKVTVNKTVLGAAACSMLTTMFFALSNKNTAAANAILLQFTAPIFIILYNSIIKRVKANKTELFTCAAVFLGILLFFFDSMTTGNYLGDFYGLLAGISYAGVFILNTRENSDAKSAVMIGYFACAAVSLPFVAGETDFSLKTIGILLFLGVFQLGAGYLFFASSLDYLDAVPASLMSGIEPILNPILVAVFYPDEKLSVFARFGAAVVLVSVVAYNAVKAKQDKKQLDEVSVGLNEQKT